MDKRRSFTNLKKGMDAQEFIKFCKKLTEEYANSDLNFSRSYFCNSYNISESCYYRIMEYAVVTNIVTDEIVAKMLNKAMMNQNLHSNGAGGSSISKYARMYYARSQYIALSYIDDEVRRIAKDFADNPDISKSDIASANGFSTKVLELILVRGIEENIVDDDVVDAMEKRSINNANSSNTERTKQYFEGLRKKREANKNGIYLQ